MWYLGAADRDAVRRMCCPNILARKASATQSTWTTKQRFSGGRCGHSASEKWRLSQTCIQKITKRDQTSDFHTVANILICDDWIPLFLDVLWLSMVAFRSQLISWHFLRCFNPCFCWWNRRWLHGLNLRIPSQISFVLPWILMFVV